jgi:NAD(P) transhydrogenase subunit beta
VIATTFLQDSNFIAVLYILAFGLFIYGLTGLTGPATAVRGNRIAAVGMGVAVIATLLSPEVGNWGLIVVGVVIGTVVGVPAARRVKMTAMPQMVALFNGVGGGAVALVAWAEFRNSLGFTYTPGTTFERVPLYVAIFSLFAAIIGSVSFWGSNIAFAKLQAILPGRPITLGRMQQVVNLLLFAGAVACAVIIAAGSHSELLFVLMLVLAGLLGNAVVLPIGGADMPVVISLLNAFTGLSAAATSHPGARGSGPGPPLRMTRTRRAGCRECRGRSRGRKPGGTKVPLRLGPPGAHRVERQGTLPAEAHALDDSPRSNTCRHRALSQ